MGNTNQSVKVPDEVDVSVKSRVVTVKGPRGTLVKSFKHLAVDISMPNKRTVRVEKWFGKKKELAAVICDSYTWSDGNYIRGNCRSKAKLPGPSQATGLFCYISGSALCSCRDVQRSNSVVDSYGNLRYYSFEACTTPPRNQCTNYGWGSYGGNGGNYGDGDFPYCSNSGSNSGSNQGWSSGSSNSNQGWSSGSSNSNQGWS